MASCPKCGKPKLRKDALDRRWCPHCGVLRGIANMDRSGVPRACIEGNQEQDQ